MKYACLKFENNSNYNFIMEKITFIVQNKWGSSIMSGYQINDQLKKMGFNTECVHLKEIAICNIDSINQLRLISNNIIIFVKFFPQNKEILFELSLNNKLFWWIEDNFNLELYFYARFFSEIIFPTEYMLEFIKNNLGKKNNYEDYNELLKNMAVFLSSLNTIDPNKTNFTCIRDHWDPRLKDLLDTDNLVKSKQPTICYIGCNENDLIQSNIIDKFTSPPHDFTVDYNDENFVRKIGQYSYHFSVRDSDTLDYYFKMNAKISTASFFNSPIITTKDKCVLELVGENYPYYIENMESDTIRKTIIFALENYKTDIWENTTNIMKKVKEETSIENVCKEYSKILKKYMNSFK